MQLTMETCVECHGKVKYSGLETGNVPWKNGKLSVQLVNGHWKMNLEYDVSRGNPQKSYMLSPGVIKKLICKAQLVIELQPNGRNHSQLNLHVKPQFPNQVPEMQRVYEKLQEIKDSKEDIVTDRAEVKMSPASHITNSDKPVIYDHVSPESFTSVKSRESRKRIFVEDSEEEEEGKENFDRLNTMRETAERKVFDKSNSFLSTETTPLKFYGNKSVNAVQAPFQTYSHKRTPGLMPDPEKKRLGSGISYSWLNSKPKLTAPTGSQQQQSLHGFSNLGNTCYMNAILQSLVHLDTFTTDLLYGNKKVLRTMPPTSLYKCMELVFNSRLKNVPDFSKREYLKNLKQAISSSAKRFSGFQQHDAHEFLGQLLDQLKEEVTKLSKSTPSPHRDNQTGEDVKPQECINPTVQNFEFEVLHRIKCEDCGEEVTKEEQFNDLSIDLPRSRDPSNPRSLQDALELSLRKEHIEYTCEKCNCTKAVVTHKFTKLPRVLILHLKRYSYNLAISRQSKAGQNIAIPRYLTLQSHCEEETRPAYPAVPANETLSLSVPDSPLREKNDNTPRRRLDILPGFRFKKVRALPDFDDDSSSSKPDLPDPHQTSTPNKKSDQQEVITDRKLTLDDDIDDPELAKALELSLKEASDRAQGYYDEVDGMVEDNDLKKVLEMSRQETESRTADHDYDHNIKTMTEEEQIELAMKRSMMEFEMQNSYFDDDCRRECGSAYAGEINMEQEESVSKNVVTSKYFTSKNRFDENGKCENEGVLTNHVSPGIRNCDSKSTYELTENSYFHSSDKCSDTKELSSGEKTSNKRQTHSDMDLDGKSTEFMNKRFKTEGNEVNGEDVMLISDSNSESETDVKLDSNKQSGDVCMEISDMETNDSGNLTCGKPDINEDEQMTSNDIEHVRIVDLSNSTKESIETDSQENNKMDIVDLFCNEDDDDLMAHWDKENLNPDVNNKEDEDEEFLPKIENEKGELPYSYRLVSIVNHIGSSSVVGHYVSDVFDIKKSSWFSCDDSHVSRINETEVRSKRERTGYIFFYLSKDIYDDLKDHYALHANKKEPVKK